MRKKKYDFFVSMDWNQIQTWFQVTEKAKTITILPSNQMMSSQLLILWAKMVPNSLKKKMVPNSGRHIPLHH
jgi:hypothetical protein